MSAPAPSLPIPPAAPTPPPELVDIRGPIAADFWSQYAHHVIAGAIVLLVFALFAVWLIRRLRAKRVPPLSPAQIALSEIGAAWEFSQGDDARFSALLSQAVRRYIEQTLALPAPERTTEEFLREAQAHPLLKGEPLERLARFLEGCDLVKFARQPLDEAGRTHFAEQAGAFVETTQAALNPPPADKADAPKEAL